MRSIFPVSPGYVFYAFPCIVFKGEFREEINSSEASIGEAYDSYQGHAETSIVVGNVLLAFVKLAPLKSFVADLRNSQQLASNRKHGARTREMSSPQKQQ